MITQKLRAAAGIFILATSPLLSNNPCPPCDDPCCPPPDPCAKCAQLWPTRGPDWIITPSAGPCVSRGWDAHIKAAFICWTVREDQLGFAVRESIQTLPDTQVTVTSKGSTFHPSWQHFEPGYKIGIGILKDHDGWDIDLEYTWLQVGSTKKRISIEDLNTERLTSLGGLETNPGIQSITQISGDWSLDFNVLDAELGRNFFISRYLVLRPFVGFKGTWQDQNYEVKADGLAPEFNVVDNHAEAISKQSIHYWGVGPRMGIDTTWHFNRCWSLFGNIATSALWEQFDVEYKATKALLTPQEGSSPVTTFYTENNVYTIKPVIELLIGLRYETWYCCDAYHFAIGAGWELQWWDSQNQFFLPERESRLGDLVLTGLTLNLRLDF